jgi:hypothetical protein
MFEMGVRENTCELEMRAKDTFKMELEVCAIVYDDPDWVTV